MGEIVELNVRIDCEGCSRKVKKALKSVKGVDDVEVDTKSGRVKVITAPGYISSKDETKFKKKLVKAVRNKAGRAAELAMPASVVGYNPYVKASDKFQKTYNYEKHMYNTLPPSSVPPPSSVLPIDKAMMFSDENPNSCNIM